MFCFMVKPEKDHNPQGYGAGTVKGDDQVVPNTEDNHPEVEQDKKEGCDGITEGPVGAFQAKPLCSQDHHADHRQHGKEGQGNT